MIIINDSRQTGSVNTQWSAGNFLLFFNFLQMYFVYKCKRTYIKEVLMGRRKCLIIPVLMAGILLMGGCSRQSIEDVKRFQETSTAVESDQSDRNYSGERIT